MTVDYAKLEEILEIVWLEAKGRTPIARNG